MYNWCSVEGGGSACFEIVGKFFSLRKGRERDSLGDMEVESRIDGLF